MDRLNLGTNPWLALPNEPPYCLKSDAEFMGDHNERARAEHSIHLTSLPEPFIGDPNTAKLILLNLNPGHDDSVGNDHQRPAIKKAIFDNLYQKSREYPFYAFNPAFGKTAEFKQTGVARWWRDRTRRLQEATGLIDAVFSKKIFVIEWFPYPSKSWFYSTRKLAKTGVPLCHSQEYSFQLARSFLGDDRVVVLGMRSKEYWVAADPRFEHVPFLINHRNTRITRGNMEPGLFEKLVKTITA